MTLRILVLFVLCLWAIPVQAQMTCLAANTSAVSSSATSTNAEPMPTAAPANATLWLAVINTTDETTTLDSVVGSVNTTGWVISSAYDNTFISTRTWYAYKVGASAGTDTVTATFSGAIASRMIVGWCSDASGLAQTFDAAATNLSLNIGATNYDSNTAAATGAGGILGFILTTTNQGADLTVDGAGETLITAVGGSRVQAIFEPYASGGNYGVEATIATASAGNIMVAAFKNAATSTRVGCMTLLGVGRC